MQTQCPHCKSQYSIGAELVDAYGGFVRCGKCNYKFNIHDQVSLSRYRDKAQAKKGSQSDHGENNLEDKHQRIEPKIDTEPDEDGINIRFREFEDDYDDDVLFEPAIETNEALEHDHSPEFGSLDESDAQEINQIQDVAPDLNKNEQAEDNPDELEEALASLLDDEQREPGDIDDYEVSIDNDEEPDTQWEPVPEKKKLAEDSANENEDLVEFDDALEPLIDPVDETLDDLTTSTQIKEEREESAPVFLDQGEAVSVNEEEEAPMVSLINDETEPSASSASSTFFAVLARIAGFLFWTALAITLAYFLFGQIKDKLYPAYKNHPVVQTMRASVCQYLPCNEIKYDTEAYEIVVSRMDEARLPERQLHISIFMMNKSAVEQVYPNILITLKRLDGSIAGQRTITPAEYFKSHDSFVDTRSESGQTQKQIIKPNKLGKVLIKLNNPPDDAVGFEARVVH